MKRQILIAAILLITASLFLLPVGVNAGHLPPPPIPPIIVPPVVLPPEPVVVLPGVHVERHEDRHVKKHRKHHREHEDHDRRRHHRDHDDD